MSWLLEQSEWWQPESGGSVRISEMADTHRWNTIRWLERRAVPLAEAEAMRMLLGPIQPGGEAACDAFEQVIEVLRTDPLAWLRGTPLLQALHAGLPTPVGGKRSRKRWGRLIQRARHWSTCPRNTNLRAPGCTCRRRDAAPSVDGSWRPAARAAIGSAGQISSTSSVIGECSA